MDAIIRRITNNEWGRRYGNETDIKFVQSARNCSQSFNGKIINMQPIEPDANCIVMGQ